MTSKDNPRNCSICGAFVHGFCPVCTEDITKRPDPSAMTLDKKIHELKQLLGPLEVSFPLVRERASRLVGRPIWTHEFAYPNHLFEEVKSNQGYDGNQEQAFEKSIRSIPDHLIHKFISVDISSGQVEKLDDETYPDIDLE